MSQGSSDATFSSSSVTHINPTTTTTATTTPATPATPATTTTTTAPATATTATATATTTTVPTSTTIPITTTTTTTTIPTTTIPITIPTTPIIPTPRREQKKITEKLKLPTYRDRPLYSFEFFPPQNNAGILYLRDRICRMAEYDPLFIDITFTRGGKLLELAEQLLENTSVDIVAHLSMTNMTKRELLQFLDRCKALGIRNILALRGDPPRGLDSWEAVESDLEHGIDLVKLIRKNYGDWFCVGVAGYPEGHVESESLEEDLLYLKQKVIDGGADWITTLLFYDVEKFFTFYDLCRSNGINVPIIPGLMPIQTYSSFVRVVSFSNVSVPDEVWKQLEAIKDHDEKVKAFGIEYCSQMCRKILQRGIYTLHFYTLNLERSVTMTLESLDLLTKEDSNEFPWKSARGAHRRKTETVRPIFWSNRDSSYIRRTQHWDEFPNGRWGDNRSPAFGEFPNHHLLIQQRKITKKERLEMWGKQLDSIEDISKVFVNYLSQKISKLPWCMEEVDRETTIYLLEPLLILNKFNMLTINSQPQINGAKSNDPDVGWGGEHGYVYQKAYLEFFCCKEQLDELIDTMKAKCPSLSFMAVNKKGNFISHCRSNNNNGSNHNHTNAVTWGVFPSSEIVQPTIVDGVSFLVWKEEAFDLWKSYWQSIYPKDSSSYKLIENIRQTWYLVNIVENDYINGDIFRPFRDLLRKHIGDKEKFNELKIDQKLRTIPLISSLQKGDLTETKAIMI